MATWLSSRAYSILLCFPEKYVAIGTVGKSHLFALLLLSTVVLGWNLSISLVFIYNSTMEYYYTYNVHLKTDGETQFMFFLSSQASQNHST